jgi:allantoicase
MTEQSPFSGLIDLASERIGGKALLASDEFFAPKENLLKAGRGIALPEKFTPRGKWMDGWESRRKRTAGHDWCVIRLGVPGVIKGIDIDTNHFLGNHPAYASLEACTASGKGSGKSLPRSLRWKEIMPVSPLKPGSHNLFSVNDGARYTHVRLHIYPDGGVARFRVYGDVVPDWKSAARNGLIDLAAVEHGGIVIAASDMFFGSKENLIMPGRARTMGDGWETKRRRGPGHDWAIIRLGRPGVVTKIEVDTNHFKGNFPESCSIDGCAETAGAVNALTQHAAKWVTLLPPTKLSAHKRHFFAVRHAKNLTHLRLNIYPDGGVSRLRAWGKVSR